MLSLSSGERTALRFRPVRGFRPRGTWTGERTHQPPPPRHQQGASSKKRMAGVLIRNSLGAFRSLAQRWDGTDAASPSKCRACAAMLGERPSAHCLLLRLILLLLPPHVTAHLAALLALAPAGAAGAAGAAGSAGAAGAAGAAGEKRGHSLEDGGEVDAGVDRQHHAGPDPAAAGRQSEVIRATVMEGSPCLLYGLCSRQAVSRVERWPIGKTPPFALCFHRLRS